MNAEIAATLGPLQRELLQELEEAYPDSLMVGRPSERSLRCATALERRGFCVVDTDESGYRYAWLTGDQYSDLLLGEDAA